jgi:hypothetical protein
MPIEMPVAIADFDGGLRHYFSDQINGFMQRPGTITSNIKNAALHLSGFSRHQYGTHNIFHMNTMETMIAAGRQIECFSQYRNSQKLPAIRDFRY